MLDINTAVVASPLNVVALATSFIGVAADGYASKLNEKFISIGKPSMANLPEWGVSSSDLGDWVELHTAQLATIAKSLGSIDTGFCELVTLTCYLITQKEGLQGY